jgi:hypothetical protein
MIAGRTTNHSSHANCSYPQHHPLSELCSVLYHDQVGLGVSHVRITASASIAR